MAGLDWPPGAETDPDVDCTADLNFLFVCDFRSLFKTQVNAGTKRQKEIISVVQYRPCLFEQMHESGIYLPYDDNSSYS